jgi:trk system potassium uptake protein TrkA
VKDIYIVIAGGGKLGSFLASRLLARRHAVAVIEKREKACLQMATSLDAIIIHGDACDDHYQEEAQVGRAHVFAAVTGDDDDNMVACQLAGSSFGVPRVVARVNNPKNAEIFERMGIDAVSSTTIIAQLIESRSGPGDIVTLHPLHKGKLAMVEISVPLEGSTTGSRMVKEMRLPRDCVLVSIERGEEVLVPHGGDTIQPGDVVVALTSLDREKELRRALLGGAAPADRGGWTDESTYGKTDKE